MFWVISIYFNIRNTLPKFCPFLLGHLYILHSYSISASRRLPHQYLVSRTRRKAPHYTGWSSKSESTHPPTRTHRTHTHTPTNTNTRHTDTHTHRARTHTPHTHTHTHTSTHRAHTHTARAHTHTPHAHAHTHTHTHTHTIRTHNHLRLHSTAQRSIEYHVQWQSGDSGAVGMAGSSSYCTEKRLAVCRTITPQMLLRMSVTQEMDTHPLVWPASRCTY